MHRVAEDQHTVFFSAPEASLKMKSVFEAHKIDDKKRIKDDVYLLQVDLLLVLDMIRFGRHLDEGLSTRQIGNGGGKMERVYC